MRISYLVAEQATEKDIDEAWDQLFKDVNEEAVEEAGAEGPDAGREPVSWVGGRPGPGGEVADYAAGGSTGGQALT